MKVEKSELNCCHFTFPCGACHPGFLIIFRNIHFEKWQGASSSQMYCYFSCAPDYLILCSTVRQFSCSVVSDSLRPHELQHTRPLCQSPTPGVHSNSRPLSRWCHPAISSSVIPFSSCPQSLPASESFPMSQIFAWGGQSTGVSALALVLPMNTQDWSPLGWTGWTSLQSKGLSKDS